MRMLVDTNILIRIAHLASPDHVTAKQAVIQLIETGAALCLVPQVIYEYWVVATRPALVNGLGMDIVAAERAVLKLAQDFLLLKDERGIFSHWQALVVSHSVSGKTAHDARLVAAMLRHGIGALLTFNSADFARFSAIQVISPAQVLAGQFQP